MRGRERHLIFMERVPASKKVGNLCSRLSYFWTTFMDLFRLYVQLRITARWIQLPRISHCLSR